MRLNIKSGAEFNNSVVILTDTISNAIKIKKEDALKIDSYIEYSRRGYNNKEISYTKYIINEKILDNQGNLLLICEEEYHGYEE